MANIETVINLGLNDMQSNPNLHQTKKIGPELPRLLSLLYGSSVNQDFFNALDTEVSDHGRLEGQSKREPIIEEEVLPEAFLRPNGEEYFARNWSGLLDVHVMRGARESNLYPLLYGEPGCGKTALAEAAFGEELVTMIFTGDTAERDLVGQFIPNPDFGQPGESEFIWLDGPLVVAMENGWPFLADEIGLGDPKVLSVLYGAMDGRREVVVSANPSRGVVKAKPGFFIIGATNPNAPGVTLSEALLSRFTIHVEMTTDYALAAERLGVPELIAAAAQSLNKMKQDESIDWAPQMRELLAFRDIKNKFGETFAYANMIAACPNPDTRVEVQEFLRKRTATTALAARI